MRRDLDALPLGQVPPRRPLIARTTLEDDLAESLLRGPGFTDVLAYTAPGERVILEAKIWKRNDYADVHQQLLGYLDADGEATRGAVVMIWPRQDGTPDVDEYTRTCLSAPDVTCPPHQADAGIVWIDTTTTLPDGRVCAITHYLLALAHR